MYISCSTHKQNITVLHCSVLKLNTIITALQNINKIVLYKMEARSLADKQLNRN